MSETATAWWQDLPPEVEALARKIAARYGADVDRLAMPYIPALVESSGGTAALIDLTSARPLWTFEVHLARYALQMRDEMAVEQALPPAIPVGIFTDPTDPTEKWRQERGLDGTDQEE